MMIDFTPQFHKRVSRNDGRRIWVAVPHPRTLIPVKVHYYQEWQREERLRLQEAGEDVLGFAIGS